MSEPKKAYQAPELTYEAPELFELGAVEQLTKGADGWICDNPWCTAGYPC